MVNKTLDKQFLSRFNSLERPEKLNVFAYLKPSVKEDLSSYDGLLNLAGTILVEDLKLK